MNSLTRRNLVLLSTVAVASIALPRVAKATQLQQFADNYLALCNQMVALMNQAQLMLDRVTQDSTLFTQVRNAGIRTDLQVADWNAANSALTQIKFTFDSGSPPQKAALFKLL